MQCLLQFAHIVCWLRVVQPAAAQLATNKQNKPPQAARGSE